jgi:hypothetical protein
MRYRIRFGSWSIENGPKGRYERIGRIFGIPIPICRHYTASEAYEKHQKMLKELWVRSVHGVSYTSIQDEIEKSAGIDIAKELTPIIQDLSKTTVYSAGYITEVAINMLTYASLEEVSVMLPLRLKQE